MALTTYNITGSLKDALGGSSLIGEVTFTPYGTHDARVDGADALLGPVRYSIADLPATVALSAGGWQITIRSTGRVNGDQQFKTITRTLDLTGPLTWGEIVAGAVSSPPMTPTLVEEAQAAADEAEMWASTAQGVQDTAVTTLVNDPASATSGALSATYVAEGGATRRNGQNVKNLRRPTLVIDKAFPNARHDHQIVWVDETAKIAYSIGQDRRLRKSSWTAAGDEASFFGAKLSAADATKHWCVNGVFLRTTAGTLLMEETSLVGTDTVLKRSTNDGVTWTTVWTAPVGIKFLGPQSICQDATTGYLYLVEYTTDTTLTAVRIMRSTDDGATWGVFKSYPRGEATTTGVIRHWHSCRYDSVSQRVYFMAGDQQADAGLYRVNAGGTDIEPVILNSQLAGQFGAEVVAPARSVDVMFFPTHIAWACDGGGETTGDHVYRMARDQIGAASPVVEQIASTNSTGWYVQKAAADGSVWVACTATEPLGGQSDLAAHLYAISDNGATVDEVGAVPMDGNVIGYASLSGLAGGNGGGDSFWLRAHNFQMYPNVTQSAFQYRAKIAWGVAPIVKPADQRDAEYLRESRNWRQALTAAESFTFAHSRAPFFTKRLTILNLGAKVLSGTGTVKVQVYNVTTSTVLLDYAGGQNWRHDGQADTQQYHSQYVVNASDQIEFRVVETSGTGTPTALVFVEFGWTF